MENTWHSTWHVVDDVPTMLTIVGIIGMCVCLYIDTDIYTCIYFYSHLTVIKFRVQQLLCLSYKY